MVELSMATMAALPRWKRLTRPTLTVWADARGLGRGARMGRSYMREELDGGRARSTNLPAHWRSMAAELRREREGWPAARA